MVVNDWDLINDTDNDNGDDDTVDLDRDAMRYMLESIY